MKPFKPFLNVEHFDCDICQIKFRRETAYSVATNWEEFKHFPTFCSNCIMKIIEAEESKKPDKRTLNKTGRTHQLGTRVRKEFLKKLKKLARKEKLKYVEVLERALDCYEKKVSRKRVVG